MSDQNIKNSLTSTLFYSIASLEVLSILPNSDLCDLLSSILSVQSLILMEIEKDEFHTSDDVDIHIGKCEQIIEQIRNLKKASGKKCHEKRTTN